MGKLVLFLSFVSLGFLLIGSLLFSNNAMMWLAASSLGYTALRLVLMAVLLTLMLTNPPRNIIFRILVGFLSVGLGIWAVTSIYQNNMQVLDGATILAASVSIGIVALEYNYETEPIDLKKLQLSKRSTAIKV